MGLFTNKNKECTQFIDYILQTKAKQLSIKSWAINRAIDLIAKTISKSEIKVFRYNSKNKKVEETLDDIYYKLNIAPNVNEVATSFFYRVISILLNKNECLIVEIGKLLYISEEFDCDNSIINQKIYSNIYITDVNGEKLKLNETKTSKDVIHLILGESKIIDTLNNYYNDFSKLLNIASAVYKSANVIKWRFKIPGGQPALKDFESNKPISYEEYKKKITNGLFSDEESIIMLSEQFDLTKLNGDIQKTSEDFLKLKKDWIDSVAMSFNIPLDIFYGNKTDKSVSTNDFITFGINPYVELLEDNFNAKLIPKDKYLKGEKIWINRLNMKHYDIMDAAGPLEKLTGIGFSHNDCRGFMGMIRNDEEWADEHNVTKNFANVKGGD